jgi:prepilin-type N-terminal cleavage/methylation domain-containing protein
MKMLAYFRERPRRIDSDQNSCCGFTLLEMLIVLLIVGLTSAVVLPRLPLMADSLDFALKRQSFEQELSGLAYRAYAEKQDFILSGHYDSSGRASDQDQLNQRRTQIRGDLRALPAREGARELLPPIVTGDVAPAMPEGWEMVVSHPIYFHGSGYCSGGDVELRVGQLRYGYALGAPSCKAILSN